MDNETKYLQQLFSEGSALLQTGYAEQALNCFQMALHIDPSNPTLALFCGAALHELKRFDEAIVCYEKTIQLSPSMGEAYNNLGNTLIALGRFAEAVHFFSNAVSLLATSPVPLTARATALQAIGRISEAEADCRAALAIAPGFAEAHWNLALNLLLQGDYDEGWREYEWRWRKSHFTSPIRHADVPLWDGSPLNGRTILLHAEQGFGDAIQFVRYAPLVAERGGIVVVECHPELTNLIQSVVGVRNVVPFGDPLPPFSYQAPLLSLPYIFSTTLQTIPAHNPYLSVPIEYQKKWSSLITDHTPALRVGLVWAGKSYPDPLRSSSLEDFVTLFTVQNVRFYSLQVGINSEMTVAMCNNLPLIDLTHAITNFADTAALVEQLDLVISVDTAVAHLAGAMGKLTWLLLPLSPDWRWLLERYNSPWYPGMQLFRQKISGDWGSVINDIATNLTLLLQKNKAP